MTDATPHTVLLVEDDAALRETTQMVLERQGFHVDAVADGNAAVDALSVSWPEVVLLDLMLPGMDGISVTRWIRERSSVPIIIITARGEPIDEIAGLEAGADDYVVKPFDGPALAARLRAALRRASMSSAPSASAGPAPDIQDLGDGLLLDRSALEATRDGETLPLTPTEMRLLTEFADNRGVALSRTHLLERVWGSMWAGDGAGRMVDVHIQRLRAKVGAEMIETVRGHGYRLRRS